MLYKFYETEIEDILVANLDSIESGMKLLSQQLNFAQRGRIDLLCLDRNQNLVIFEIKTKAYPRSVYQIEKYLPLLNENFLKYKKKYRKILCYLTASRETKALCILNQVFPFRLKYSSLLAARDNLRKALDEDPEYLLNISMKAFYLKKQFSKIYH